MNTSKQKSREEAIQKLSQLIGQLKEHLNLFLTNGIEGLPIKINSSLFPLKWEEIKFNEEIIPQNKYNSIQKQENFVQQIESIPSIKYQSEPIQEGNRLEKIELNGENRTVERGSLFSKEELQTRTAGDGEAANHSSSLFSKEELQTPQKIEGIEIPPPPKLRKELPKELLETQERRLEQLYNQWLDCNKCPKGEERCTPLKGIGPADSELMVIVKPPGRKECLNRHRIKKREKKNKKKICKALQINDADIFITPLAKCFTANKNQETDLQREKKNREEKVFENCLPLLEEEIKLVSPKVIISLGPDTSQFLLKTEGEIEKNTPLAKLRLRRYKFRGIPIFCSYALRRLYQNPKNNKPKAWEDWQNAIKKLRESKSYD